MTEHVLKCWPVYFDALASGMKNFEVRKDDRGFQKGDTLLLQRTRPNDLYRVETDYHGKVCHELRFAINWILTGGQFGIEPGYVVLALHRLAMPAVVSSSPKPFVKDQAHRERIEKGE
ncbi:hypothetical protein ABIF07_001029 [Bradyrhizobium elkanii]|uniref:DUF3850 domain-containing protein n=1 Tax=Bradyrhizobium elkanii TaxID=29448 RepID=UPI00216A75D9|nr:hypothetical protein [Bradyrhizobium elkanii]